MRMQTRTAPSSLCKTTAPPSGCAGGFVGGRFMVGDILAAAGANELPGGLAVR